MSLAVDQRRIRSLVEQLMPTRSLDLEEMTAMLLFVQHAAGIDPDQDYREHAVLQAIAQQVGALTGLKPDDVGPIPMPRDERIDEDWLGSVAALLTTPGSRDLTFALSFLVSVADLRLTAAEHEALEGLQRALEIGDRRVTELVVLLAETCSSGDGASSGNGASAGNGASSGDGASSDYAQPVHRS